MCVTRNSHPQDKGSLLREYNINLPFIRRIEDRDPSNQSYIVKDPQEGVFKT